MRFRNAALILLGIIMGVAYTFICNSISHTQDIWFLTRINGLIAYLFLVILIAVGELKLLGIYEPYKLHIPSGILAVYFTFLHFLSAAFDRFKWGKDLSFIDYLGFNFSSKWLILLSIGTIAFYLMLLISLTSIKSSMRYLGFKKWKNIHLLSYITLIIVFIHTILLGTDIKTGELRWIFFPLVYGAFFVVVGILPVRLLKEHFSQNLDKGLALCLVILLSIAGASYADSSRIREESAMSLSGQIDMLKDETDTLASSNMNLRSTLQQMIQSQTRNQQTLEELTMLMAQANDQKRIIYPEPAQDAIQQQPATPDPQYLEEWEEEDD